MHNQVTHVPDVSPTVGRPARLGVTMPELMVVIGVIVVLLAILLPVLGTVRGQANMTSSMNNMRQIGTFMRAYERDNRETILPSQFDYRDEVFTYKGKVRAPMHDGAEVDPATGERHAGTWADILWTINEIGSFPAAIGQLGHDYSVVAPDRPLYDALSSTIPNPFRAAVDNTKDSEGDGTPKPHGTGARESGYPGYFAANNFFNASPDAPEYDGLDPESTGRWWSAGQIRVPERSLYLIDSFVGETIEPQHKPFDPSPVGEIEVDFRYSGSTLMLMLDGNIRTEGVWAVDAGENSIDVLLERGIRVTGLDRPWGGGTAGGSSINN